jgi:two-component system, OmpR family, response regulator
VLILIQYNPTMNDLKILKNLNVLYVDDDIEACESIGTVLQYYFNNVYIAKNGFEALDVYKKKSCNVLLVDYDMPIMNGYEFLKEVRNENSLIPAVIISSYDDKDKLFNAIKLELVEYLVKPFEHNELKELFHNILEWMKKKSLLEYQLGDNCIYSLTTKQISNNNKNIDLTSSEYKILEYLLFNENILIPYDTLIDLNSDDSNQNSLVSQIYKIKKKIGVDIIKNVKNEGYILKR